MFLYITTQMFTFPFYSGSPFIQFNLFQFNQFIFKGKVKALTLSSISSSFSLVFIVMYSFSIFFIFFALIFKLKANDITISGSDSNLAGISFWKYWKQTDTTYIVIVEMEYNIDTKRLLIGTR